MNDLRKYVSDYASRLDKDYTQKRTYELIEFYHQLVADVGALKGGKCDLDCPASWSYDASACSCLCEIDKCSLATQSVDFYNCKCVEDNGCELTNKQCAEEGNKLLDYSNCQCEDSPVSNWADKNASR